MNQQRRQQEILKIVENALTIPFAGWNFSFFEITGTMVTFPPRWNYFTRVKEAMETSGSMVDLGTGGGEFLSLLKPYPPKCCATESWMPNFKLASEKLKPLGINVFYHEEGTELPFDENSFDLVISRHESFNASELRRVMKANSKFITQQVGGKNNIGINNIFNVNYLWEESRWCLETASAGLREQGFSVNNSAEEYPVTRFYNLQALVYYLRAIPWQLGEVDFDFFRNHIRALELIDKQISEIGWFEVSAHRFYLEASLDG